MTERDLTRILTQSVQDVHLPEEARRRIRQAAQETEESIMKKKTTIAIALATVLMLLTTLGVAAGLGLFDQLEQRMGVQVLNGAQSVTNMGVAETEFATFTVREAAYDGYGASVMVEVQPRDERTFLMNEGGYLLNDPAVCITGSDAQEDQTIGEYIRAQGYEQVVEVSATFLNAESVSVLDSREGSGLTLIFGFEATGDAVSLAFEGMTVPYGQDGGFDWPRAQRTSPLTFTLQAEAPLWAVRAAAPAEVPEKGIRIDSATLVGTRLGTYLTMDVSIPDISVFERVFIQRVDAQGNSVRPGVTLVGGTSVVSETRLRVAECNQPMEQPPEVLHLRVFDYDTNTETFLSLPIVPEG